MGETNPNATTTNTPAGPESPDDLPKVTPAVNPHDPTVNAATTSDEQDLLQMPWRKRKKKLYDMPWHELKEFAEAHEMNINFLKHERGGNKNGLVDDIMAHIGSSQASHENGQRHVPEPVTAIGGERPTDTGGFEPDADHPLVRGYIPCPKCNKEGDEEIPFDSGCGFQSDTGCDESGRRGWVMMEPCGRDGCNPHGTTNFNRKRWEQRDHQICGVCGGARWNRAKIYENTSA